MKRLIDGMTYNTDTATLLARSDWNTYERPAEGKLYQTRGGAFFIVEAIEYTVLGPEDQNGEQHAAAVTKIRLRECSEDVEGDSVRSFPCGGVQVFLNPFEDKVSDDEQEGIRQRPKSSLTDYH